MFLCLGLEHPVLRVAAMPFGVGVVVACGQDVGRGYEGLVGLELDVAATELGDAPLRGPVAVNEFGVVLVLARACRAACCGEACDNRV